MSVFSPSFDGWGCGLDDCVGKQERTQLQEQLARLQRERLQIARQHRQQEEMWAEVGHSLFRWSLSVVSTVCFHALLIRALLYTRS